MAADIGQHHLPWRHRAQQRLETHADQRRQVAARHLRGCRYRAELRRKLRVACPLDEGRDARRQCRIGLDRRRLAVRGFRARIVLLLLEDLTDLHERRRVGGIERRRATEVVDRGLGVPVLPFEQAELAMQERAVRAGLQRALVTGARLGPPARGRGGPRPGDHVLKIAEAQDLDPPGEIGHRAVDGQRRFERRQRLVVAAEGEERLSTPHERRDVLRRDAQRVIECSHGTRVVLAREGDVGRPDLGRIQRRRPLQRRSELPIGVLQIVVLQVAPAEIDAVGVSRPPQLLRHRRVDEFRVLRHSRQRRYDTCGTGSTQDEQPRRYRQSSPTPHRSPLPVTAWSIAR